MTVPQASRAALGKLICEFLGLFYQKGWVSGTGGGICAVSEQGTLLMAPTAVHKERIVPGDLFVVDPENGMVLQSPRDRRLRPSECGPVFCTLINHRPAGAVVHSHALSAVLAADQAGVQDHLVVSGLEMLKGIREVTNRDKHPVPVIQNTPEEPDLVRQIREVLERPDFRRTFAILVRDHGAYIWGENIWEAKRHAEVYHFLFEAMVARGASDFR